MAFYFHSYLKSDNEVFLCRAPIDSFVTHIPLQSQRRGVTCQKTHSFKKSHNLLRKESGFEHLTIRLQAQFFPPKERLQRTSQCPESHTRKRRWSPSLQRRNHSVLLLHGSFLCYKVSSALLRALPGAGGRGLQDEVDLLSACLESPG